MNTRHFLHMNTRHFLHMPTGKVDIAETLMKQLDFDTKRVRADYKLDLGVENILSFVFPQLMEPCLSSGGRHMNQYKYD